MQSDLGALSITAEVIDKLIDLSPVNILAIDIYRAFMLRQAKPFFSVVFTDIVGLILLLVFVAPVTLILLRNLGKLPEDVPSILRLFTIILGVCLLGIAIWNVQLWKQAKQMKSLVRLLDEVDKYNGVIKTLTLIDEIESISNSMTQGDRPSSRKEVIEALKVTKESLIGALKVERLIRKHDGFNERRYQLLANLENNLNTLMSFDMSNQASEYGRLLNESLQIGMSVHKEMRKLQNR